MRRLHHFISDIITQVSCATDVLFTTTTFSTKTLGDIVNSAGIRIQVCLVIYPFLRLLLTFIFIVLLKFLFLQNVVHAETVPSSTAVEAPESGSSETVPKTNLLRFALGFGLACVALFCVVKFMNGTLEAPEAPEEFYLFSSDISVPVQDYAVDLFNSTTAALTVLPLLSKTAVPLYTFCFSHMLNFFDNSPDHVAMIKEIKSLVLPVNSIFRNSAPTETNVYVQVLKCYAEMFTQLNSDIERNICKVLSVNHRILTIYDPALNHSQIIRNLFAGDGIEKIFNLVDKSVTKVLIDATTVNVTSDVLDSPTFKAASLALYNSFVGWDEHLKDTASVLSLIKKSMPVYFWDLPGKAISAESLSLLLINSLDSLLVQVEDPSRLYYFAKIKASIATYNALSASDLLDNKEIADNLMSAFMTIYSKEYLNVK